MSDWKEVKTLQDLAAVQAAGEEIQCAKAHVKKQGWYPWDGCTWYKGQVYRSRPAKKTKTIVLREALYCSCQGEYSIRFVTHESMVLGFIRWLDTPERIVEVE